MAYTGDWSIASLSEAYSTDSVTPSQVVRTLHARIVAYAESNPHVWIDVVPLAKLLERAEALEDLDRRGQRRPSLWGVPFSVKNNIDVEGFRTTCAGPLSDEFGYDPRETATVVRKCLDAGAIFVGTTNLDQFATGLTGCRSPYGTPACHQDGEYAPGGSSSGSAVSVAAKLVAFSLGTDTAGSVRVPAALNGVWGFKPTFGRVSKRGVVPAVPTLDCVGILATSAADCDAVWNVVRGYDERDAYSRRDVTFADRVELGRVIGSSGDSAQANGAQGSLRMGLPPRVLLEQMSREYRTAWETTIEVLERKGFVTSEQFDYAPFEEANGMVYGSSLVAQRIASFDNFLSRHGTSPLHPIIRTIFDTTPKYTAIEAFRDLDRVAQLKRQAERQFRDAVDVLVVPSTARHYKVSEVEADPFETNKVLGTFSQFVNLLDLCAIAIPVATWTNDNGNALSFGITLIAEAGRDDFLLQLAKRF